MDKGGDMKKKIQKGKQKRGRRQADGKKKSTFKEGLKKKSCPKKERLAGKKKGYQSGVKGVLHETGGGNITGGKNLEREKQKLP